MENHVQSFPFNQNTIKESERIREQLTPARQMIRNTFLMSNGLHDMPFEISWWHFMTEATCKRIPQQVLMNYDRWTILSSISQ